MHQHIQAHDVRGTKRRRLRLTDGRAGAGVHFFNGHSQFIHQAQRIQQGKRADAIGDEVWGVLRHHYALAQAAIAKLGKGLQYFSRCLWTGN